MQNEQAKEASLKVIADSPVKPGQVWRHVKTGNRYFVMAVALDEVTLDPVVVYSGSDGVSWTRSLSVFLSKNEGHWRFVNDDDVKVMIAAAVTLVPFSNG